MSDKNTDWLKRLQLLKNALKENGVDSGLCVELETKISGYELDFSEHDKVFEDKIELLNRNLNLQKDKRCEAEIERNYLAERFNQLKDKNDELKQRIAELESKETSELPFDALETANMLINATYKDEIPFFGKTSR